LHPALVELSGRSERLPYKAAKTNTYWKGSSRAERRTLLRNEWQGIVTLLEGEIQGVAAALPPIDEAANGMALKAYEDKIDAVVCAWCAIRALSGEAEAFGDADAAIWIPQAQG
jgi:predicted RNase H-like nuclease